MRKTATSVAIYIVVAADWSMTSALTGMSGKVVPAPLPLMFVHVTVPAPVIVARQT